MARISFALLLLATSCARPGTLDPADLVGRHLPPVTAEQRREYLGSARIFDDVDPRTRDLLAGPPAFGVGQRVSCRFIEPYAGIVPAHGTTPKFFCELRRTHEIVKVKYGRKNGEIYGEVLGARLLWALGVAADANYAVRVHCEGCPAEPWIAYRDFPGVDDSPRGVHDFDDAILQRLYPAALLQERPDQGWTFGELAAVMSGKVELDALRLLAAFIAHGDDKPENQRLVCPFHEIVARERCRAPRLLIADLGSTFGRGTNGIALIDAASRPSFAAWSKLPMWDDREKCLAHWAHRVGHGNLIVSEAGRKFLAARLGALSHRQIRDLFTAARIERLGETTDVDGETRAVTVEDWALAFERRRTEILDARCPEDLAGARPGP